MNTYQVYISGSSNPVYTYKTFGGLFRRLMQLAKDTRLASVEVCWQTKRVPTGYALVKLSRDGRGYGWHVPTGGYSGLPKKLDDSPFTTRMGNYWKGK